MFNLGTSEIVIILVVALLILGPAKLPEIGKQIGQMLREFRNMSGDVQKALDLDGNNYRSYDTEYSRSSSYDYSHDEPKAIEEQHEEEPKAVEAFSYSAPKQGAPVAAIDTRRDEETTTSTETKSEQVVQNGDTPHSVPSVSTSDESKSAVAVAKPSVV